MAPSLNTAMDLFERHQYNGKISFLVNENSLHILQTLFEDQSRFPKKITLNGKTIHLHTMDSFPSTSPKIDLYIHLTCKHRESYCKDDLKNQRIPVIPDGEAVILIQTGLGNLESLFKGTGKIEYRHRDYQMASAGLDKGDAGIYSDYDALLLRKKSQEKIRNHLLDKISEFTHQRWAKKLKGLLEGKYLRGALVGFAYGLHEHQAHQGLHQYLDGLKEYVFQQSRSAAMIVPALYGCHFLNSKNLPDFITVIEENGSLPQIAKSRQIYIIRCPVLPPSLFNGFLAYSELPPVITGSMALSAAIVIGKPFVMASLSWNHRNIRALKNRLLDQCRYHKERKLINALYAASFKKEKPDLTKTFFLLSDPYKRIFRELQSEIPNLTDHIIESASVVKATDLSGDEIDQVSHIKDPILRWDMVVKMANARNQQAFSWIVEFLKKRRKHPFQEHDIDRVSEMVQLTFTKKQPHARELRDYLRDKLQKTLDETDNEPAGNRMKRFLVEAMVNLDMKDKKAVQLALDWVIEKIESQDPTVQQDFLHKIKRLMDHHHVQWKDQVIFLKTFFRKKYQISYEIDLYKKNNHEFLFRLTKLLQKEYGYEISRRLPIIPDLYKLCSDQSTKYNKNPFAQVSNTKKIYFANFFDTLYDPASIFASLAIRQGFQVDFGYHTYQDDEDTIEQRLTESKPDLVAISFFHQHRHQALLLARAAKKIGMNVIAGGWYPTIQPNDLKQSGYFDAIVKGDGTGIFPKILENVEGLDGSILYGKRHSNDAVYFQRYFPATQKAMIKENKTYETMSSIGCPINCADCPMTHLRLRVFPLNLLIDSLEKAVDHYEVERVIIWDNFFTSSLSRLVEFRENFKERSLDLRFIVHAQTSSPSSRRAEELRKIGVEEVWFGVDGSLNWEMGSYHRKTFDSLIKQGKLCQEYGMAFCIHLIVGLPTQTEEDYKTLVNLVRRIKPHKINVSYHHPLPVSLSGLGKNHLPENCLYGTSLRKSFPGSRLKQDIFFDSGNIPDDLAVTYKQKIEDLVERNKERKIKLLPLDDEKKISSEEIHSAFRNG